VRGCARALFLKSFAALSASGPRTPSECTGESSATARRAAVTRANLNCTLQIWAIFSHPCTVYRQLKFCVQSLLHGLCKREKFRVRFRPDKPDHSLVRQGKELDVWFQASTVECSTFWLKQRRYPVLHHFPLHIA
jgi:hypothetical protein